MRVIAIESKRQLHEFLQTFFICRNNFNSSQP
jgi:hypothetical protein